MVTPMPAATGQSGGIRARAAWSLADQGVSSIGNFLLIILVARRATTSELGTFGLAFTTWALAMGASRSLATEPLIVRFTGHSHTAAHSASRSAMGASLVLAGLGSLVLLAATPFLASGARSIFLVLGLTLPFLLLQDAARYAAVVQSKTWIAFLNDSLWSVLAIGGLIALTITDTGSVTVMFGVWAVTSLAGAALSCSLLKNVPDLGRSVKWIVTNWNLGRPFLLQFLVETGALSIVMFVIAGVAGLAAVAALRVASTIFGPVTSLFRGVQLFLVPEMARLAHHGATRRFVRMVFLGAAVLSSITLSWLAVSLWLPYRFGVLLFGESWQAGRDILIPFGIYMLASALIVAPYSALRALGLASAGLRVALVQLPVFILGPLIGAYYDGARGAAIGLAIAGTTSAILWWWRFQSRGKLGTR